MERTELNPVAIPGVSSEVPTDYSNALSGPSLEDRLEGSNESSNNKIERIICDLVGSHSYQAMVPQTIAGVREFLVDLRKNIQLITVRIRRDPPSPVSDLEWSRLAAFLSLMWHLDVVTQEMRTHDKLDIALKLICDPVNKYAEKYSTVAQAILNKLEAVGWGAPLATPTLFREPELFEGKVNNAMLPDDTDPVYGLGGIMHHILRIQSLKGASYSIRPGFKPINSKVFGNNGLRNGQWFPFRIVALRDGAHGQSMSGISGSTKDGAYSVVVSGQYHDLDQDHGDTIFYSGSNSHDNVESEPADSIGTRCLAASVNSPRPVRVLRTSECKWVSAPRAGLRYDGLYRVVSVAVEKNSKGGAYKRFKLERIPDQAPIMTMEPGHEQILLFQKARNGYTKTVEPAAAVNSLA